ncbi:MAG: PKD domain-containing protein [Flavobacteriales bacterium]|nr:PKD domain-containing protein [Flavobacteriales bacterium]MDW8432347.1 PKD domain-containing protein [Flavobacteriales bacterium]
MGRSQCPISSAPNPYPTSTPITVTCNGSPQTITTCHFGGEYFLLNVTAGNTYLISNCGGTWDSQITVYNNANSAFIAYNDDNGPGCAGLQASVQFTASFTGVARVLINQYNCITNTSCIPTYVTCTSPPCPSAINVTATPPTICPGQTSNLNASSSGGNTQNGFAGAYAPSNWTTFNNNSDGIVNAAGAPSSISIVSGNNGSGTSGTNGWTITVPATGNITFSWSYTTTDGPQWDYPQYVINNGTPQLFPGYSTSGGVNQSGTATIPVTAGSTFTLQMYTVDNVVGAATVTITNFTAPTAGGGTISWFLVPSGGVSIGTSPSGSNFPVTPSATTTYYAEVVASGCTPVPRTPVTVTVTPLPPPSFTLNPVCENSGAITLTATPSGGTWSGTGVSGSQFNPGVSGVGTFPITYTYTSSGCTASATQNQIVHPLPTVNLQPFPQTCFNSPPITLSGGSPPGGSWSGTGVSGNTFTPSSAGIGTFPITYSFTDANGCTNTATQNIVVNPVPTVSHQPIPPICSSSAPVPLTGGTPAGGVYSGPGVIGSTFDPSVTGVGTFSITYTVTGAGGCQNSMSVPVQVVPGPNVVFNGMFPVCENAAPFSLVAGSPSGGTYSGPGVVGGTTFDPSLAGSGTHTLTYTYSDANGCTSSATQNITVHPLPSVTLQPFSPVCVTSPPVTLSGGNPAGGTWSGTAVSGNQFDPSVSGVGTFAITYSYTDPNNCSNSASQNITVNSNIPVTHQPLNPVCVNDPPIALTGGSPSGGSYSGPGVVGSNFDPAVAGVGTHSLTYTVSGGGGCTGSTTISITVNPAPSISITPAGPFCISDAPVTLNATPSGGTWSGPGTTPGGVFDPSLANVGSNTITYTVSSGGCTGTSSLILFVFSNPDPTITPAGPFCSNASPFTLTAATAGGTWSGPGTSPAGVFDPSVAGPGSHVITYTVGTGACQAIDTETLVVNSAPTPSVSAAGPFCISDPAVSLTGTPAGGTWTGPGVSGGGIFTPSSAGVGTHTVAYSVTQSGCTGTASQAITVNANPNATITPVGPFCENASPVTLNAATSGGTWSGPGVSPGGLFNPSAAGVGSHTISYSVTVGSCSASSSTTITVNPVPSPSISAAGPFCTNAGNQTLIATPTGGTWSGPGTTPSGIFNPATAGAGSHAITYSVTQSGCTGTATSSITVNAVPQPVITPAGPFCTADAPVILTADIAGGAFSGPGITVSPTFSPSVAGPGTHPISYSVTVNGCTGSATTNISVTANPTVNITPAGPFCVNGSPVTLTASPSGGVWSGGPYVTGSGIFDPALATIGNNTVSYSVTQGGCSGSATTQVAVIAAPNATINPAGPFCTGDNPVQLTAATSGGTWAGPGTSSSGLFSPSAAGSGSHTVIYNVTQGGCTASSTTVITVSASPSVNITPAGPLCQNSPPVNLSATPAGGTWSGTGVNSSGVFDPSQAATGSNTITYSVSVGGCSGSGSTTVQVNPVPTPTITPVGPFCTNSASVNLTAAPSGGSWSGTAVTPGGTFNPSAAGSGTFTLTYTVTQSGCTGSSTTSVTVNPLPNTAITPAGPFCSNSPDVQLTAASSGGTWSGTGVSSSGLFSPSAAGPGSHIITYSLTQSGCTGSSNTTITVNATPTPSIAPVGPFCSSATSVTLSGSPGGGTWSGPGTTSGGVFTPSSAGAGTHTVTYTVVSSGCTGTASTNIVVNPVPAPSITSPGPLCTNSGIVTLSATPPGGSFSGPGVSGSGLFDPAQAGAGNHSVTYTVTAAGCTGSASATISVTGAPNSSINTIPPLCANSGPVTLTAQTPGGTWSGTAINPSTGVFTPANSGVGTFSITYTVVTGVCTSSSVASVVVNPNPAPALNIPSNVCTNGGLVPLSATPAGGVWSGTGVSSGGVFDPSNLAPGPYTVVYTVSQNGCTGNATGIINVNATPNANFSNPGPLCLNANPVTLTPVTTGGTWSGPVTSGGVFDPAFSGVGTHTVTYSLNVNGCSNSSSQNILVNPLPNTAITPVGPLCSNGTPVQMTAATNGGSWSGAGITASGIFNPQVAGTGSHTISYSLTQNGCTGSSTTVVQVDPAPSPSIAPAGPFCTSAGIVNLAGTPSGGVWTGTGVNSFGQFDPAGAGAGNHTIQYQVTSGFCSAAATTTIVVNPAPNAAVLNVGPLCENDPPVQLTASTPGGTFSGPGVNASGLFNPGAAGPGQHVINYTVTQNGCTATGTTTLQVNAAPNSNILPNGPYCSNQQTVTLQAAVAGGTWYGPGVQTNGTFTPAGVGPGSYVIYYTLNIGGCTSTNSQTVVVNVSPDPTFTLPAQVCFNAPSFSLNPVTPGGIWTGSGVNATGIFTPAQAGVGLETITYTVTNANCTAQHTEHTNVIAVPDATITTSATTSCTNAAPFQMTAATGGGIWAGSGIIGNGLFDPALAGVGTATITYTIQAGQCTAQDSHTITVNPAPNPSFTLPPPLCTYDPPVQLVPVTPGGAFSGTGVTSGGLFDPSLAGSTVPITYTVTQNACTASETKLVIVNQAPNPTITPAGPFCSNQQPVLLSAATPGGTWSGPGMTPAGYFNPQLTGAGTFTVTYSVSQNGCSASATYDVLVNAAPVAVFDTAFINNGTVSFVNLSQNATNFQWSFGDGNSSTAFSPTHTYQNGGTYFVTLVATNACGSASYTMSIFVKVVGVGLESPGSAGTLVLYPNPASEQVTLHWDNPLKLRLHTARLMTLTGTVVSMNLDLTRLSEQGTAGISLNHLADGLYFLELTAESGEKILLRFIKSQH